MNREAELQQLSIADTHVAKAERVISTQMAHIAKLRQHGHDTILAEEILRTFEINLQRMCEHREMIVMTIKHIDQGF